MTTHPDPAAEDARAAELLGMLTAERINQMRRRARLSQTEVGKRLGISHAAVSDIERGKTRLTLALLEQFAAILEVHWSALLPPPHGAATAERQTEEIATLKSEIDALLRDRDEDQRAFRSIQIAECANCYARGICYFDLEAYVCVDYQRCLGNAALGAASGGSEG